jgi:lysophospholipase L1-like esterase
MDLRLHAILGCAALLLPFTILQDTAHAAKVLAIGDSLTAEYDVLPEVPGFDELPTDYAKVTVAGWEAMSWVEIAGRLRARYFNFGEWTELFDPWPVPRLSGFEFNWAVPGVDAGQYEEFVTSSILSHPLYFALRQPLEDQLANTVGRVVVWLGGNDFRAEYGRLYDGGNSDSLVDGLIDDLTQIIDFVQDQDSTLQIVIANIPDLGATPSKKAAHPDPAKRARVTAATVAANARIGELAAKKGVAVADVFSRTAALVRDEPLFFGAVRIFNESNADNNPRYAFVRDGLHPNTALQILIAREIIHAFNRGFGAGIPNITDAEALALLSVSPDRPYLDWLARFGIGELSFTGDPDDDGIPLLAEYAFGLKPRLADAAQLPVTIGGPVPGLSGNVSVRYTPRATPSRYVAAKVQYSSDGAVWRSVPSANVRANRDGSFSAAIPPTAGRVHLRMKVVTIPPSGSGARASAVVPLGVR